MSDPSVISGNELELQFMEQYRRGAMSDDAAKALCEIWKNGEYLRKYRNFTEYVKDVFGISKTTAYRKMGTIDQSVGQYCKTQLQFNSSMPLNISESCLEKLIAEKYWSIFHAGIAKPQNLTVVRQANVMPYGRADIVAWYQGVYDQYPKAHIVEVKAVLIKERDLAQVARYRIGIMEAYRRAINPPDGFNPTDYISATLVGPCDRADTNGYVGGANGDFLYLCQSCEIDVWTCYVGDHGIVFESAQKKLRRGTCNGSHVNRFVKRHILKIQKQYRKEEYYDGRPKSNRQVQRTQGDYQEKRGGCERVIRGNDGD